MFKRRPRRGEWRLTALRRASHLPIGGFTFAEDPVLAAPDARILWHADLDPGTLRVWAIHDQGRAEDLINPAILERWLTVVAGSSATEHVVLSDGWHRVRLDVERGSLAAGHPVMFRYLIEGTSGAAPKILPLRRLLHLCRHGYFAKSLYPREARVDRWLLALRVRDAVAAGASQKDIACVLFGRDRVQQDWEGRSDALRMIVRRLAAEAQKMARGGFRSLMKTNDGR